MVRYSSKGQTLLWLSAALCRHDFLLSIGGPGCVPSDRQAAHIGGIRTGAVLVKTKQTAVWNMESCFKSLFEIEAGRSCWGPVLLT